MALAACRLPSEPLHRDVRREQSDRVGRRDVQGRREGRRVDEGRQCDAVRRLRVRHEVIAHEHVTSAAGRTIWAAVLAACFLGGACGGADRRSREVTAYVSADRPFSEPIMQEYERRSGVRVNVVYDTEETKSTGLANRLLAESRGRRPTSSGRTSRSARWC